MIPHTVLKEICDNVSVFLGETVYYQELLRGQVIKFETNTGKGKCYEQRHLEEIGKQELTVMLVQDLKKAYPRSKSAEAYKASWPILKSVVPGTKEKLCRCPSCNETIIFKGSREEHFRGIVIQCNSCNKVFRPVFIEVTEENKFRYNLKEIVQTVFKKTGNLLFFSTTRSLVTFRFGNEEYLVSTKAIETELDEVIQTMILKFPKQPKTVKRPPNKAPVKKVRALAPKKPHEHQFNGELVCDICGISAREVAVEARIEQREKKYDPLFVAAYNMGKYHKMGSWSKDFGSYNPVNPGIKKENNE